MTGGIFQSQPIGNNSNNNNNVEAHVENVVDIPGTSTRSVPLSSQFAMPSSQDVTFNHLEMETNLLTREEGQGGVVTVSNENWHQMQQVPALSLLSSSSIPSSSSLSSFDINVVYQWILEENTRNCEGCNHTSVHNSDGSVGGGTVGVFGESTDLSLNNYHSCMLHDGMQLVEKYFDTICANHNIQFQSHQDLDTFRLFLDLIASSSIN